MNDVDALHAELEYAHWEPELKRISGVWTSIQNLRKQAKGPAGLKKYRQYLERCIGNLQTHDAQLSDEEVARLRQVWGELFTSRTRELHERTQSRLPRGIFPWCEKWLPTVARDYSLAIKAFDDKVTRRHYDRLMEVTRVLFDEFERAV